MTAKNDLHKLIINNLAIVEETRSSINEISEVVFDLIDAKIAEWVKNQKTGNDQSELWNGQFDFWHSYAGTNFYPEKWKNKHDIDPRFQLRGKVTENGINWLSLLCNQAKPVEENDMRILFLFPYNAKSIKHSKSSWRTFLLEKYELYKQEFSDNSVEFDSGWVQLFIRLTIDPKILAENYPDNIEDALTPIDDALEKLKNIYPIVDEIFQEAFNY